MIECETIARRWGNSLGVTLPKDAVEKENIQENEEVTVLLMKKNNVLKKTFGMVKGELSKSAQKIKDEARAELYND